jgi:hypothetical protein
MGALEPGAAGGPTLALSLVVTDHKETTMALETLLLLFLFCPTACVVGLASALTFDDSPRSLRVAGRRPVSSPRPASDESALRAAA